MAHTLPLFYGMLTYIRPICIGVIVSHCVRTGDATNRISGAKAWSLTGGGLPILPGPTFGASDATFFLSSPFSFLLFVLSFRYS